ncbi:DUF547 domain-containing protein [Planktotalea sp.]|uniref:DUF547 domain-containing protein n=1 Tax=Planktotalea sp. TaxID=2029877 RepID=UPI003296B24D
MKWSSFAPEAWEYWELHDATSTETINHGDWDSLLKDYVKPDETGLNRFAYGAVSDTDKAKLASYIDTLETVEVTSLNRDEQLAYWLNLYNALTIKVVLDHYPVSSIKDIDISGLLANGPWKAELIFVEDVEMSLDAIEHEILRPIWNDPRIHYGVNCASIGCPNLHTAAFEASTVDDTLTTLARDFVNHPRGVSFDGGDVIVSSIYSWFAVDFGNSNATVLEHIKTYADPELKAQLDTIDRISDHSYDWTLNE